MSALSEEQRAFLLHGSRTGKLATVRRDGRPHVVPIWFTLEGDTIIFMTGEHSVKASNMRRDARVCLSVDDETPPFAYIMVEGTVSISSDLNALRSWAAHIAARYMGEELAEAYGARNGVAGELLIRMTPTRILFEKDIAG